jgi:periplasmic protein TonB
MTRAFEFTPFLFVALSVHLWAFGSIPGGAGSDGGDSGFDQISLNAPSGDLAALVADWMRPPATSAQPPAQQPAESPNAQAPQMPQMEGLGVDAAVQALPELPKPSAAPALPQFAQALAAPSPRPQARPEKPRPAQAKAPAQRAAGSGKQASAGQGGKAQDTARNGTDQAGLMAEWGGAIRTAVLRNQGQPAQRASGTVHLRVSVRSNGQLAGVAVRKSSGHAALDAAAIAAVQRARLPAAPKGLSGTQHFNLPISFRG